VATRSLWRHRDFLLLWGGQTVSEMGSAITQLALIALPAGALVDRHAKRRLMIWCDAARLVIIGSVPVAAALGVLTLAQLYVVAATAGVCTVFFDVAYQSLLPVPVAKQDLVDGNGKLGATQSFAQVTGPGIGGGLVGLVGLARPPRPPRPPGPRPAAPGCGPRSPKACRSCCGIRSCARSWPPPEPRTCS
jgi:MFS family permease